MKKIFITLVATIFVVISAVAIPAKRDAIKVKQSDGSTITIRSFGDEFHRWMETTDGYIVTAGADGFLYYDAPNAPAKVRAHDPAQRGATDRSVLSMTRRNGMTSINNGMSWARRTTSNSDDNIARIASQKAPDEKFRTLVVLVNFSDKEFTVEGANAAYSNLVNQDGYSVKGATGSVWNYYYDNSNGQFDPQFDVVGPVTLPRPSSYYGSESASALEAFMKETVDAVGSSVDWSLYSDDNTVRPIFIFYAGYGEHANPYNGDLIWPHQLTEGYFTATTATGQVLHSYACTSEYDGAIGSQQFAAIGAFCHEFGHVLGLPDLYDTDQYINGDAQTPLAFSLMDMGSYNNESRTPPSLTAMELEILGWLYDSEVLSFSGDYTLPHISEGRAYKVLTGKDNDYFWIETRGSSNKWDKYMFNGAWGGLFVVHVDRTSNYISRWGDYNNLNAYSNHPCYLPVRANSTGYSTTYMADASTAWLFPGSSNKTTLSSSSHALFNAWGGGVIDGTLSNIKYVDGEASFTFKSSLNGTEITSILQNDAIISVSLPLPENGIFRAELIKSSERIATYEYANNSIYLPLLLAHTEYNIRIYSVDGEGNTGTMEVVQDFKTLENSTEFAAMGLMKGTFTATEEIPLRAINLPANVESVAWSVDGDSVEAPSVTLSAGKHQLTLVITTRDGNVETITRYVNVE